MQTVGTRELKQNPAEVIQRVLTQGEDAEITAYGRPTGVRLVADRATAPQRWVRGAALAALPALAAEDASALRRDLDAVDVADDLETDPWEGRE